MVMHHPPHHGEVVREFCIEPLRLSATEAAKGLGVSRAALSFDGFGADRFSDGRRL